MSTCWFTRASGPRAPTCNRLASANPAHLAQHHSLAADFGRPDICMRLAERAVSLAGLFMRHPNRHAGPLLPRASAEQQRLIASECNIARCSLSAAFARLSGRCRLQMRSCTRGSYDNGLTAAQCVCLCKFPFIIIVSVSFFSVSPSAWLRCRGGTTQLRPLANQPQLSSSPNTQRG